MNRLHPVEEWKFKHFSFKLGPFHRGLLMVTLVFCIVGLLLGSKPLYVGKENYETINPGFTEKREALGYTGRITFQEIIDSLNPRHPLHELEKRPWKWISYEFGTNIHNYCFRQEPPNGTLLPSLLRLLEFRASSQFFFRTAVLISVCVRMFLSVVSGNYVWLYFSRGGWLRPATLFLPWLDLVWMAAAMLVLCLQMDQDAKIKWVMHWHLPVFGAAFFAYGVLYIAMTSMALRPGPIQLIQLLSMMIFAVCFPLVCTNYLEFLAEEGKPCSFRVPLKDALIEYITIFSVMAFVFSQFTELSQMEAIITILKMEHDSFFETREDYMPVYLYDNVLSSDPNIRKIYVNC